MALAIVTVAGSIANLSISNVTIRDVDEIPTEVLSTRVKMLFPDPLGFVTNFTMRRDSYGGASAKMTITYNLNYTYCHVPTGEGRTGLDHYDEMVTACGLILDAILGISTLTGAVDITPQDVIEMGPVPDPSGRLFLGFRLVLNIMEFVN